MVSPPLLRALGASKLMRLSPVIHVATCDLVAGSGEYAGADRCGCPLVANPITSVSPPGLATLRRRGGSANNAPAGEPDWKETRVEEE